MFVDSHCHINFEGLADRLPEVLGKMRELKVTHALCVSVDLETLPSVFKIAEENEQHLRIGRRASRPRGRARTERGAELVELAKHPKSRGDRRDRDWTITAWKAAASPRWNGSANASARIFARRTPPASR